MSPVAPIRELGERLRDFAAAKRLGKPEALHAPISRYAAAWGRRNNTLLAGALVAFMMAIVWAVPSGRLSVGLLRFAAVAVVYLGLWRLFAYGGPIDRRRWKRARIRWEQHADAPWTVDHRWDPRGEHRRNAASRKLRKGAVGSAWLVFWVPWMAYRAALPGWVLALVGVMVTMRAVQFWRVWGRGDLRVGFTRFPYHPGESVEIHLGITPRGPEVRAAQYVLYRFEEHPRRSGKDIEWRATHTANPVADERALPSGHADIRLGFDIPADAGGTCLSAEFPSYWELQVALWTDAGFTLESFLVPIYERVETP